MGHDTHQWSGPESTLLSMRLVDKQCKCFKCSLRSKQKIMTRCYQLGAQRSSAAVRLTHTNTYDRAPSTASWLQRAGSLQDRGRLRGGTNTRKPPVSSSDDSSSESPMSGGARALMVPARRLVVRSPSNDPKTQDISSLNRGSLKVY